MAKSRKWGDLYNLPEIVKIRELILKEYNNKLTFIEESHQYFLGDEEYDCVSNIIERWSSVDEEEMLNKCAIKAADPRYPDYKYHGMTREEIKKLWEDNSKRACDYGTICHAFGESCYYWFAGEDEKILPECKHKFNEYGPIATTPEEEAILKFWEDLPDNFIGIMPEIRLINFKGNTKYAGTTDILFYYYDKDNPEKSGVVIFDWKTNQDLYKNFKGTKMLWPFNNLLESPHSHYILQLNLYQLCLENLGIKVLGRRLIWVKPDATYEKVKLPYVVDTFKEIFAIND